jgi:hypothetical protein
VGGRSRRGLTTIVVAAVLLASFGGAVRAQVAGPPDPDNPPPLYQFNNGLGPSKGDNVVLRWDEELLQAIRANPGGTGPTITARALGVAHTAMFDAWAPYDARAVGTRYGGSLRRPVAERTPENKAKSVSFAAYAALVDLFPSRQGDFALQMKELGYATDGSDTSMPATIGTMVAKAVTDYRHKDGANRLGGYADTTGYLPVNTPAQAMSRKRGDSLNDDVKLFFALGNAVMDASIAAWAWKFKIDYVRPITGIREYFRGQAIVSWLGPYRGYGPVKGENWIPYQEPTVVTPPFPEYVSGHSTFSAAGARVIRTFFGTDTFGASVTIRAGTSRFEPRTDTHPGSPARDVTLSWPTFSAAAGEAGQSRRYGGIHFPSGDLHGRGLGDAVGGDAWTRTQSYIRPFGPGPI